MPNQRGASPDGCGGGDGHSLHGRLAEVGRIGDAKWGSGGAGARRVEMTNPSREEDVGAVRGHARGQSVFVCMQSRHEP